MATSNDLDSVSGSWDEHSVASEHNELAAPAQVQVAQAAATEQPAPAASEPVPVDVGNGAPVKPEAPAEAKAPPAAAPHEYVADAGNIVKLPANVSIDNIRVDGDNLLLEQADGTVIVIKDGALHVPTFLIGDVEVPRVALLAALEASHVDVAFGADGSISAGGGTPGSAGGNFEIAPGGIGDGFGLSDLLPPTDLQFGRTERQEVFLANANPLFANFSVHVSEEGLPDANPDDSSLPLDTTNSAVITGSFGATDPNGDPLTYSLGVPDTALTSHGVDVVWDLVDPSHLVGTVGGEVVISITITNASTGAYQIALLGPLDHPLAGSEDDLSIVVPVTVQDPFGGSATATMTVVVEDDSPALTAVAAGNIVVPLDETASTSTAAAIDTGAIVKGEDPDVAGLGAIAHGTSSSAFVNVTALFGADGPAASGHTVYALTVTNAVSGLTVTDGSAISLQTLPSGVVVGVVQGSGTFHGQAAFALSIDPATGKVTVEQYLSLHHPDTRIRTKRWHWARVRWR